MRVLELSLRNFRVFEEVDLELPARVIGIFGPNGGGKSALMESLTFGLYGVSRTKKQDIRTSGVLTDCLVRVAFEHGGKQYEVRRSIKGRNHQTGAELFVGDLQLATGVDEVNAEVRRLLRMDQQVFRASVFAEQKQLDAFSDLTKTKRQEMVLRLLGIKPVDDARAAARKDARTFKESAEQLGRSLPDMAEHETRLTDAREQRDRAMAGAEAAAVALQGATTGFAEAEQAFAASDEVRQKREVLVVERRNAGEAVAGLTARREELTVRLTEMREELERLPALEKELAGLADARDLLEQARQLAQVSRELAGATSDLAAVPAVDPAKALAALEAAEKERTAEAKAATRAEVAQDQVEAQLELAREAVEHAGELDATQPCPTCGQALGDAFRDVVAHRTKDVVALEKKLAAAEKATRAAASAQTEAEATWTAAKAAGAEVQEALQRRGQLEEQVARLTEQTARLGEPFDGKPPDLDDLTARAIRAQELDRAVPAAQAEAKHLGRAEKDLSKLEAEMAASATRIEELEAGLAELAFDEEAHAKLAMARGEAKDSLEVVRREDQEARAALAKANEDVAGLEGRLAQARETVLEVERLRGEARYAERVGMLLTEFRGFLYGRIIPALSREAEALFRELTNSEYEDLRIAEDDLSIQISDGGVFYPIERFSGSETDLANLALRVAISVHLSRMSGADIGLMVLDEVFGSLDAERKDLMVQAMGRLADRFHQLFVITHADQIKDQFGAGIEIRKVRRRRSVATLV